MAVADHFDTVQQIYIAFYQRPADPAGLKYWAENIDAAGGDLSAVINAFATSAEATELYGEINEETIGDVIDSIYQGLFGRDADEAGKAYYAAEFAAGNITAGSIALAVLSGAQNDDETAIANKLAVANEFTQQVDGRELTDAAFGTAPFNVTYSGSADAEAARGILADVTADAATVLTPAQVTAALRSEIADEGDPIGDLPLSEALAAYQAAVDAQEDAADAYAAALVAGGDEYGVTEGEDGAFLGFNPETDYVAIAEAGVQTQIAALAEARAGIGSDAAVNAAVTQAQAAIRAYDAARFSEAGVVATEGTTYTLAQLQARATSAQAALDTNIEANGETAELAQELNDAVALYVAANGDLEGDVLETLQGAIADLQDETITEAQFLDAVALAKAAIFSVGDGKESALVEGARGDAVEALVSTLDARNTLSDTAELRQGAFEAAEDVAAADPETFEDVNFVGEGVNDLTSALEVQAARQEQLDALADAEAELAAIEDAAEAYADAVQQATDAAEALGFDVIEYLNEGTERATEDADLFIFDADALDAADLTQVAVNGIESDDVIYLGADYALGTVGAGNNNVLEVFLTEEDGNAVLQIENSVYGSNAGEDGDFTSIILTGISAADVTIEGGIVTFA